MLSEYEFVQLSRIQSQQYQIGRFKHSLSADVDIHQAKFTQNLYV
jgi:hypothetical protein